MRLTLLERPDASVAESATGFDDNSQATLSPFVEAGRLGRLVAWDLRPGCA
jgi:hypothetical protein